tara:strand:- start:381 stop:584 length:204 start_codon:yes stop_codon:yes gene_type:complete
MRNEPRTFKIARNKLIASDVLSLIERDILANKIPIDAVPVVWSLALVAWKEYEDEKNGGFTLKGGCE